MVAKASRFARYTRCVATANTKTQEWMFISSQNQMAVEGGIAPQESSITYTIRTHASKNAPNHRFHATGYAGA
jgi:hypothetical protein